MKCRDARGLLSDYVDGELPGAKAERLQRHLADCDGCRDEWEGLRRTVRLVAHLGRETCPVDLRARVVHAVSAPYAPGRAARAPLALPVFGRWAGAGVALATGVVGWQLAISRPTASVGSHAPAPGPAVAVAGLHEQYGLANALGTADGLMLSLPTRPAAVRSR